MEQTTTLLQLIVEHASGSGEVPVSFGVGRSFRIQVTSTLVICAASCFELECVFSAHFTATCCIGVLL